MGMYHTIKCDLFHKTTFFNFGLLPIDSHSGDDLAKKPGLIQQQVSRYESEKHQ